MTRSIAKTMHVQGPPGMTRKGLLLMEEPLHTDPSVCTGHCLTEWTECHAWCEGTGQQKERGQLCTGKKGVFHEGLFAVLLRTSS